MSLVQAPSLTEPQLAPAIPAELPESAAGVRDVAIVGSGPAGFTAALYTARAQLRPVVFEGEPMSSTDLPGGQLMLTTEVENFPGFPDAVAGPNLMGAMRAQAERFGAELRAERVVALDLSRRPFALSASSGAVTFARAVILATGARSLSLGVPGEAALLGRGVSTCATCDGFFFRGQDVVVIGGGDSACEEALFLTRFARSVTVLHRRARLRASRIMADRVLSDPNIVVRWNTVVESFVGTERLEAVLVRDVATGEADMLTVAGCFVAIGHVPVNDLVAKTGVATDDAGYLLTDRSGPASTATSVPGLFAAWDLADRSYRQAITAAASGCQAAMDVERYLAHTL